MATGWDLTENNRAATLAEIARRDPDRRHVHPTMADRKAHKAWAVSAYGEQAWVDYLAGQVDQTVSVAEDLAYVAWVESQDHELPCGCMASDPEHHCEDPIPDDDNPNEEH